MNTLLGVAGELLQKTGLARKHIAFLTGKEEAQQCLRIMQWKMLGDDVELFENISNQRGH